MDGRKFKPNIGITPGVRSPKLKGMDRKLPKSFHNLLPLTSTTTTTPVATKAAPRRRQRSTTPTKQSTVAFAVPSASKQSKGVSRSRSTSSTSRSSRTRVKKEVTRDPMFHDADQDVDMDTVQKPVLLVDPAEANSSIRAPEPVSLPSRFEEHQNTTLQIPKYTLDGDEIDLGSDASHPIGRLCITASGAVFLKLADTTLEIHEGVPSPFFAERVTIDSTNQRLIRQGALQGTCVATCIE